LLLGPALSARWQPILRGHSRQAAFDAVSSIADALEEISVNNPTLGSGDAGLALFFAYLNRAKPGEGYEETALRVLERATTTIARRGTPASLFGGFPGVAWTAAHLQKELNFPSIYSTETIDRRLLAIFRDPRSWKDDYDLVSGLTGRGVYSLECLPSPSAISILKAVVRRLDQCREGETWRRHAEFLASEWRKTYPRGWYDLGMAHGLPGIIAFLARVCSTRDRNLAATRSRAKKLLHKAVPWLLQQQLSFRGSRSVFPAWVDPRHEASGESSRLAWCYGDLGIAAALFLAARSVKNAAWKAEAMSLARQAAKRSFKDSGVFDTRRGQGSAGTAHLFNRFYQATGADEFRDAACRWFLQTLTMRRRNAGVAGFPARLYKRRVGKYWSPEPGLLNGAAGVGLALLSAATEIKPAWDRLLLISNR
jgi:hypothetical protein